MRQVLEARGFQIGYELGRFKFDRLPPEVTVQPVTFEIGRPVALTGTVGSVTEALTVEIAGKALPAVDHRNGTVYVSWHNYAKNIIYVDKSTSGGATWGADVAAATTNTGFGMDIGCVGGRRQSPAHHLKVGPAGTLHLVYANNVAGKGYDILYKRSTNGGASWSGPVTLNTDTGAAHQFHPWEPRGVGQIIF